MDKRTRPENEVKALYAFEAMRGFQSMDWGHLFLHATGAGMAIYEIRIKVWENESAGLLMVIKAHDGEGTPVVGFHTGGHPVEMLASAARRIRNGSIRWKEDQYYRGGGLEGED